MSNLPQRIERAVAFPQAKTMSTARRNAEAWADYSLMSEAERDEVVDEYFDMAFCEYVRLQPLLARLAAVVREAETHAERCEFEGRSLECLCEALASLDAELRRGEK